MNFSLQSGHGDGTFPMAFEEMVLPVLNQFRSEQILVSLGVDAHYNGPLASHITHPSLSMPFRSR